MELVDPVTCLARAEQMLEDAVAVEVHDGEALPPERAELVRQSWLTVQEMRAGGGASDAAVRERSALLLGQAALLGEFAGLDADAAGIAAEALGQVVDGSPPPSLRRPCLELLATLLVERAERAPDDGAPGPEPVHEGRPGVSRADLRPERG